MSMLRLQGALLRGTEILRIGVRHYSSAKAKEEARRRWTCEQVELLEVLEARVKQLQADNVSELLINKVQLTVSRTGGLPQSTLRKATVPRKEHLKHGDRTPVSSSRWMEKLTKEKSIKHKRLLRLEAKLSATVPNPGTKPVPDQSGKTQAEKSTPKRQASNKVKNNKISKETAVKISSTAETPVSDQTEKSTPKRQASNKAKKNKISKEATVKVPSTAETALPLGSSHDSPEELREQVLTLEDATENFPLEEDDGIQHGNIQLSIISYLDCCIFNQQLERAQQCLMYYHRSPTRKKLLDVRMYNLVMHGYAKKGALYHIGRLFHLLEDAGLKPNLDSYIAALQCMGRSCVHPQVIARCLRQLQDDGFCLEDLLSNSVYEEDEVEMAVKAIQKVVPGFQPTQPLHNAEACTVPLLQNFYTKERPHSYPKLDLTVEDLRGRFQKQLKLEASDTVTIDSVEATKPLTARSVKAQELLTSLRSHWRASLLQSLRESKIHMDQRKSMQLNLYPFLCVLKDKEYVDILLQSLSVLPPQGESLLILARELGTKVYNKYIIQKRSQSRSVQRIQRLYEDYVQLLAKDTQSDNYLPREYWEKLEVEASYGPSLVIKESTWPHSLLVQLGLHLVELLVQVLKMESNLLTPGMEQKLIPVLYHVYSFRSGRQIGFIRPHPILTRLLLEAAETTLTFDSFVIPMLCPPVPWVSPNFGAYILTPTKLMRCVEGAVQHHLLLERCPRSNLYSVMDSLNQLGNCPWKVNQPILDIVISIFNDKGNEKLDIPPPPSEAPQPIKHFPEGSPLTKVALKREMARCRKKAVEMYSLRMDALYKLSIAKHMGDRVFWFPHNMDFRGRTYPCPPHFNHLGSDLTRGLLLFAEGKPLGPQGLDWLKIHLINLTGLKKKNSLQERLAYANEIMDDILDSADYPLTGRKWWMNTDEPWQALACCMEIAKATRAPDPAAYISHFPVHQDGSCNGLQHYAALGRDVVGAASVNLTPCDVPQDVYSGVAQQVEVFRKRDAEQEVKIAQFLEGFIGRKVVKQTVMTVVYGVTRYGGRLQIEKRLKEIDDFPQEYVWEASHYLVQQVFNSLKEMFSGTREIQSWLTESARLISKSGRTVEWVTPLGLPIIQPYHRSKTTLISSSMQTVNLKSRHDVSQKPDTMKQKNAFPPNFIHSLDSTHMMLTALHCHRQGLTFVSVHDCYWTHALTVDVMNRVCREQFVELHSQPILEDLSKFMLRKYCVSCPTEWKNKKTLEYRRLVQLLSNVPKKGEFDLQKVKESTYFFS